MLLNGQIFPQGSEDHGKGGSQFVAREIVARHGIMDANPDKVFSRTDLSRLMVDLLEYAPALRAAAWPEDAPRVDLMQRLYVVAVLAKRPTVPMQSRAEYIAYLCDHAPPGALDLTVPMPESLMISALKQVYYMATTLIEPIFYY